jgi:S-adenosylmethionine synthetase
MMPLSIHVDTYGTSKLSTSQLVNLIHQNFDLRPGAIARDLHLNKPIFQQTACYGHFGRDEFSWEHPKPLSF